MFDKVLNTLQTRQVNMILTRDLSQRFNTSRKMLHTHTHTHTHIYIISENKARFAEENIFRKPTNKTWVPNNKHHSIETFIEAARNEINNEIENTKRPNYSNLSVKEQKALQELQSRDDIVITETDKNGAVVILDSSTTQKTLKDYITTQLQPTMIQSTR